MGKSPQGPDPDDLQEDPEALPAECVPAGEEGDEDKDGLVGACVDISEVHARAMFPLPAHATEASVMIDSFQPGARSKQYKNIS